MRREGVCLRVSGRRRQIGVAVVAALIAWAAVIQGTLSVFSSVTGSSGNSLTALSLDPYRPATVSASRTGPTACTVTWTASVTPGPPANLRYDVTDGSGTTLATSVSGTTTSVTIASAAVTPTVKARVGAWVSAAATTSSTPCAAVPDAPTNVALTAGTGLLVTTWTAPSGNGSAVTGYTVSAVPSGGGATVTCTPSPATATTCTLNGLTNGTSYAVTVTATNANGAGPASTPVYGTPIAGRQLDGVTAPVTAAYSVRRLRAAYAGVAMTVRRASDSTTSAIGFDGSGDLDTATLLTFCAATSCYVTTWNDQSGAGKDLVQATAAAQPRIVNSGVVDTIGGRPTLVFSGAQQLRTATDAVTLGTTTVTANAVANGSGAGAGRIVSFTGTGQTYDYGNVPSGELLRLGGTTTIVTKRNSVSTSVAATTTQLGSFTSVYDGTNALVYNGTTASSSMAQSGSFGATGTVNVGANLLADGSSILTGNVSEVTLFASALGSTDRSSLAGGQSGYFLVPDAPTAVAATAADTTSVVTWTAPTLTGSTAITGYTVTAVPSDGTLANATCTAVAPATTCTLTGLTNGVTYTVSVTATNSSGTGPASTSTSVIPYPATIMSAGALKLWLDGAAPSTLLASSSCTGAVATSTVGCWTDKSTSANHFSQATAGSRPGLATVSARSVPTFDGTSSSLLGSAATLPSGATASATFVVARMTDPTPAASSYRTAFSWGTGVNGQTRSYQKDNLSASAIAVAWGGTGATAGSWPGSTWGLLDDAFSGSSYTADLNGITGSTVSGSFSTGTSSAAVGAQLGPSNSWQGQIGEIAVVQGTLTSTQRRTVQEYLARKWGITVVPATPTGVTATAGDTTAVLSWTAPSWDGGASVTGYTATAVPADGTLSTITCTSASTGCTLTGLTNGATYSVTVTATNSVGTGTASTAISVIPYPATVMTSSATKLWLDGADPTTLLVGGCAGTAASTSVDCWKDRSTSANNVAAPSSGQRPTLSSTTSTNGTRQVPLFDGVDDMFYAASSTLPTTTADSTAFVVAELTDATPASSGDRGHLAWGGSTTGQVRGIYKPTGTNNVAATAYQTTPAASGTWPIGTPLLAASQFTAGTYDIRTNGKPAVSVSYAYNTNGTAIYLSNPSYPWKGRVDESIVLNSTLSATQRRSVEEYLARKWGVTITPSAPTALTGSVGDAQATLSWTAPSWNGGSTITGYTVTASPGGATCAATYPTSQCTVTGLTNGTGYTFTVTATNAIGIGPASAATTTLTPPGAAGTVTGVTLTPGDAQLGVSWTAPGTGSPYTLYTVTGTPSDNTLSTVQCTATPPSTTCTLTGLTNGGHYAVTVLATNAAGPGTATAAVTGVPYPASVMTAANLKLWLDGADGTTLLASNACTGAAATSSIGCWKDKSTALDHAVATSSAAIGTTMNGLGTVTFSGTAQLSVTRPALGDSSTYAVVRTTQSLGNGSGGSQWWAGATVLDGDVASVGTNDGGFTLVGGHTALGTGNPDTTATSQRAMNDGTAHIMSGVRVQAGGSVTASSDGTSSVTATGATTTALGSNPVYLGKHPNNTTYSGDLGEIVVLGSALTATNQRTILEYLARKWGSQITPSAPTAATANPSNASATVSWTAPAWNGGSTITSYTATASPGGATCTATYPTTQCTVSGLTNGTAYTFTVTATNGVGTGPASAATASATPFTVPGAPTGVSATAGDTTGSVSWTAPSANGSAITGYTVTATPSDGTLATITCSSASSPCGLTGLTNGGVYSVTVTATNAAGTGSASAATTLIPYPASIMTSGATNLWMDGADSTTLFTASGCTGGTPANGGAIGCWKDKSTQANNAVQATGGIQATLSTLNGLTAPTFNGSAYYPLTVAKLPTGTTSSAIYVALVQEDSAPTSSCYRHVIGWGAAADGQGRVVEKGCNNTNAYIETFGSWASASPTRNWTTNLTSVFNGTITSSSVTADMNGQNSYSISYTNNTGTSAGAALGATGWSTGAGWVGRIAEVVILTGSPTSTQNRSMQEYLARKWGALITPQAPRSPSGAVATTTSVAVSWTAPSWNGGSSVTGYTVTSSPGGLTCSTSGTSCTVGGLTHGVSYTFTVKATNAVGTGPASSATGSVTP